MAEVETMPVKETRKKNGIRGGEEEEPVLGRN